MIKIIFYFLAVLLPSIIHGDNQYNVLEQLNLMATQNQRINNIFKPIENGYLASGTFGFTFKGILNPPNIEVAMKFTKSKYEAQSKKEFEIYSYLTAVNNPSVEAFGIPSVYYYGRWDSYILMAITLLDTEIKKKSNVNAVDVMIIFREFVRISKYIHSRGICHNNIKVGDIMFRKNQGFIIGYTQAFKMYESEGQLCLLSSGELDEGLVYAKNDWQCFFVSMCNLIGIEFEFFIPESEKPFEMLMKDHLGANIISTMESLEKIDHSRLRKVFIEFAKHAFHDHIKMVNGISYKYQVSYTLSFYDRVYRIINEELANFGHGKPILISWLSEEDKQRLSGFVVQNISSVKNPFGFVRPTYTNIDYDFFRGPLN